MKTTLPAAMVACVLSPCVVTPVWAAAIPRIVTLGDSLSDTGNVFLGTKAILDAGGTLPPQPPVFGFPTNRPIPPSPPYFEGRFSDGPVWLEHIVSDLAGVDPRSAVPALAGGFNYAFGGAQTSNQSNDPLNMFIDLDEQVDWFLSVDAPQKADLFVVFAGANDLLLGDPASTSDPVASANDVADAVRALVDAGGQRFFVPNLPALGELPATRGTPISGLLNEASVVFNATLAGQLNAIEAGNPAVDITRFDLFDIYEEIRADPAAFGFSHVGEPILTVATGELAADPSEYVFFDPIHISAATHELLGERATVLIAAGGPKAVPIPVAGWLGLALMAPMMMRRRERLRRQEPRTE